MDDQLAKRFYENNILDRVKTNEDNISLLQSLYSQTGGAALINIIYPVGIVITLGVATDPAELLGVGTWTAIAGRVIVGIDGTQTEFDALDETGGSKTHTLTTAQIPAHTHVQNAHTHVQNSHNHTQDAHQHATWSTNTYIQALAGATAGQSFSSAGGAVPIALQTGLTTATNQAATAVNQNATAVNQDAGGGGSHNNLQPYIVKYVWQRTA